MRKILLFGFIFAFLSLPAFGQTPASSVISPATLKTFTSSDFAATLAEVSSVSLGSKTPLILIHGFNPIGVPSSPSTDTWNNFIGYFNLNSQLPLLYKLYTFSYYSNFTSVANLGVDLRNLLDDASKDDPTNFGNRQLAMICHSMGGLIGRSALGLKLNYGGYASRPIGDATKKVITLATPNHGTPIANGPARDQKISDPVLKNALASLDFLWWNATSLTWNQYNRSDMRWDNYDGLLNLTGTNAQEINSWLVNLNADKTYDSKIIAYAGVTATQYIQSWFDPFNWGSAVLFGGLNLTSDGVVPFTSAQFIGHAVATRYFANHDHGQMANGKDDNNALFNQIAADLLDPASLPRVTLISPTGSIATASPTYKWNAFPSASRYILSVDDNLAKNKILGWYSASGAGCDVGNICSATPTQTVAIGSVNWRITAVDGFGDSHISSDSSFTVGSTAKEIILVDNVNRSSSNPTTVVYRILVDGTLVNMGSFFGTSMSIARDNSGNYYFPNVQAQANIIKISPDGRQAIYYLGQTLAEPMALAVESNGSFIIGDNTNNTVYRYNPTMGTVVPILYLPYSPAQYADISIAIDPFGNIIVGSDTNINNNPLSQIVRILPDGSAITVFSGNAIRSIGGLTIDSAGNYAVTDYLQSAIWLVSPGGGIKRVVSNNLLCCNMVGIGYDSSTDSFMVTLNFSKEIFTVTQNGNIQSFPVIGNLEFPYTIGVFAK
jgi:triacylglycerol esterase/lipase EstA (alpha/beta hydrolase family)